MNLYLQEGANIVLAKIKPFKTLFLITNSTNHGD